MDFHDDSKIGPKSIAEQVGSLFGSWPGPFQNNNVANCINNNFQWINEEWFTIDLNEIDHVNNLAEWVSNWEPVKIFITIELCLHHQILCL